MCVACRTRKPGTALLRFRRRPDGHVVPAYSPKRAGGRSAYLCPSRSCYETAIKRRAFTRTLAGPKGLSVATPGSTLWVDAERAVTDQVEQLRRTGAVDSPSSDGSAPSRRLKQLMQLHGEMCREHGPHQGPTTGVHHGEGSSL
ncbi:MAG: YlxR family protein [Nannocystaceae bacterium]